MAETAGVPAVGIICSGFMPSARTTAEAAGQRNARLVEFPSPNIGVQSEADVRANARVLLDEVIESLTGEVVAEERPLTTEPSPREIVFRGTLEEVNDYFYENRMTDALPIVPPTPEKIQEFLKHTDRSPDEVLGVFPPEKRSATPWTVAVNGVMAGCRPEYMPVLMAITEAVADPRYSIGQSGSTSGWAPMIIVNGPIIDQLHFQSETSVTRPGRRANTTIGRFLRLFMVNVPRFLPGITDKATFGLNFFVVLAEAEHRSPWEPLSVSLGFNPETSVVTVNSVLCVSYNFVTFGSAENHMQIMAEEAIRALSQDPVPLTFGPERRHMLVLSPLVASILSKGGYSRRDIQQYLFENVGIPASKFDRLLQRTWPKETACSLVKVGKLPESFCKSENPDRKVPLMWNPDEFLIVVAGDPTRNRSFIATQCGDQGLATSRAIEVSGN
ncbi:MAG: hypothetical protein ABII06_15505 [Pseudomonadota bacterium]